MTTEVYSVDGPLAEMIREDVTSFSPEHNADPIDQDPLGAAFYSLLASRYGYRDPFVDSLCQGLKLWADEKLSGAQLSPYVDRDVTALCLATYSFQLLGHPILDRATSEKLLDLAGAHFNDTTGFFGDPFQSALIATCLYRLSPENSLTRRAVEYVRKKFSFERSVILNDAKTAYAYFLLGTELNDNKIMRELAGECFERVIQKPSDCPPQERIYLSLVAIEGFGLLDRPSKRKAEAALRATFRDVHSILYSTEADPHVLATYGRDSGKLSRLLLTAAKAFTIKFTKTQFSRFGADATKSAVLGFILLGGYTAMFVWATYLLHKAGVVPQATKGIASKIHWGEWWGDLFQMCEMGINILFLQVLALYLILCWKSFRNLIWRRNSQYWVYNEVWETYKSKVAWALIVGLIASLVGKMFLGN